MGSNQDAMLRMQVAATTRLLVMENIMDYSGHVAVRAPGRDAFFIQSAAEPRSDVTPHSVLLVDFEGKVLEGDGRPPFEIPIHIEIFKARPDVEAVVHCHMELAIWFTMMEDVQLMPMRARAIRWRSGIPTDDDPSHIKTTAQGRKLAATLGPHHAALMRAHGLVLTAESLPALLVDAVHFDENARAQFEVMKTGKKPMGLTEAEMELVEHGEMREFHIGKLWAYYVRKGMKQGLLPADWQI